MESLNTEESKNQHKGDAVVVNEGTIGGFLVHEGFLVQEVKTLNRSLQNILKTDVKQLSDDGIEERKSNFKKLTKRLENLS